MGCDSSKQEQKVIVVLGASGKQGSAVIRNLLKLQWNLKIKAVTRRPNILEKDELIVKNFIQVVEADLDDIESLKKAFTGAYGVFAVTNFWEHFSGEREKEQIKNIASACSQCVVQHVVWSTLENTSIFLKDKCKPIQGSYTVPHFDAKADGNDYFINFNVPYTFLHTSFYYQNFIFFGQGPKKFSGQQMITFNMGKNNLAMVDVEDIGKAVANIFFNPHLYINTQQYICSDQVSCEDIAKMFSEVYNIKCKYNEITDEAYRGLGFSGAEELGNMFCFYRENPEFNQNRNLKQCQELIGQQNTLSNFKQWLIDNKDKIPVEL